MPFFAVKVRRKIYFVDQTIDIPNIFTEMLIFLLEKINCNARTPEHKFRPACCHEMSLVSAFDQCSAGISWARCCNFEDRCDLKKSAGWISSRLGWE